MERIPDNDPEVAKSADGVLKHLCGSLQLLASPVQAQLSHFPAHWVVLTDEMALDFDQWLIEIPPPAREENGMLVDNGSYFIKSDLPSWKA